MFPDSSGENNKAFADIKMSMWGILEPCFEGHILGLVARYIFS